MNTAGLEWFGPPEHNTLRPLCVVLLESGKAWSSVQCASQCASVNLCSSGRALPFICPRGARTLSGAPTYGPGDVL